MILSRTIRLFILFLLAFVSAPLVVAQEAPLQDFDQYVNKALKDWEVPGVAVAIVKDDKIVFAKGYGVRKLGESSPVSERTIFAIGSASKAFTAASIAMLVDEGKVKWDDPAATRLSGFQLFDPYATRELSVRDLLCHRSGLERGDLLWYGSSYDRNEILRRVRHLKPSWSFRANWGYQNIMYLAAGQLVPALTGKSWDEFVKERIFKPLGMTASSTSIIALRDAGDVATPHSKIDEKIQIVPWRNIDNIAPAGSINSNVAEMAQWVRLHLGEGSYQNQRLISSGALKEMHTPQTVMRNDPPWSLMMPEAHFLNYGLGWFLHDYRGRKVVEHGGNIDGMSALVTMIPEEKLGAVILTNLNGSLLPNVLMYRIFDAYLGAPPRDWSARMMKARKGLEDQAKAARKKMEDARIKGTNPSLALEKYVGTYQNEMYGEAKVEMENGRLMVHFGQAFNGELGHWHYDTFQSKWRDPSLGKSLVTFDLNAQGKVDQVILQNLGDFKRAPDPAPAAAAVAMSEEDLKKFTGKFSMEGAPIEVSIEIVGGKLKATVPGQPVYTLIPVGPARFQIEGAPAGFFVQYDLDGSKAKSITIEQGPGQSITLKSKA